MPSRRRVTPCSSSTGDPSEARCPLPERANSAGSTPGRGLCAGAAGGAGRVWSGAGIDVRGYSACRAGGRLCRHVAQRDTPGRRSEPPSRPRRTLPARHRGHHRRDARRDRSSRRARALHGQRRHQALRAARPRKRPDRRAGRTRAGQGRDERSLRQSRRRHRAVHEGADRTREHPGPHRRGRGQGQEGRHRSRDHADPPAGARPQAVHGRVQRDGLRRGPRQRTHHPARRAQPAGPAAARRQAGRVVLHPDRRPAGHARRTRCRTPGQGSRPAAAHRGGARREHRSLEPARGLPGRVQAVAHSGCHPEGPGSGAARAGGG